MKKILSICLIIISKASFASAWSEYFIGNDRMSLSDTIGGEVSGDIFSSVQNPSWMVPNIKKSSLTIGNLGINSSSFSQEKQNINQGVFAYQHSFETWALAFHGYVPVGNSYLFDSGDVTEISSPSIQRAQYMQFQLGFSKLFFKDQLSVGFAIPVLMGASSTAELLLSEEEPRTRLRAGIKPHFSYVLGVNFKAKTDLNLSFCFHEKTNVPFEVNLEGSIPADSLGGATLDFLARGKSTLYYDPRRLDAQISYNFTDNFIVGLKFSYSYWSAMPVSYLELDYTEPDLGRANYDLEFQNTWESGIGFQWKMANDFKLNASYLYRQSPYRDLENYYHEKNLQTVAVGVGYSLNHEYDIHVTEKVGLMQNAFVNMIALGVTWKL